jgi:hypothetical protein
MKVTNSVHDPDPKRQLKRVNLVLDLSEQTIMLANSGEPCDSKHAGCPSGYDPPRLTIITAA